MDNFLNELKANWKQEKAAAHSTLDAATLAHKAAAYQKNSLRFQYGNVAILSLTLVLYVIFFKDFLLHGTLLSKTGFLMMAVPLALRIAAELISIHRGRRIKPDLNATEHTEQMIAYHGYRKWMHGTLTFTVLALYTAGYYCIMVQFTQLVPGWLAILLCVVYPVVAWLIIVQVRKGIRKEMDTLACLTGIANDMEQ